MIRIMLATAVFATAGLGAGAASAGTVAGLRWEKRILIVFARDADDARLAEQAKTLLGEKEGLAERKLLVFAVAGDKMQPIYGDVPAEDTADGLRRQFAVPSPSAFTAVLVGKDGGEKWRGDRPIEPSELFGIIDAIPMRRKGG